MNIPEIIYKAFDLIVKPILFLLVSEKVISRRLEKEREHWSQDDKDYYFEILGTLHDRASTMVSHLSLMVGVCSFLMTYLIKEGTEGISNKIVVVDLIIYIILVLLTLRCLRSIGLDQEYETRESYLIHLKGEITLKYRIIQVVSSFTICATIVLAVSLVWSILV